MKAGQNIDTGIRNVNIAQYAGNTITEGEYNVNIGYASGYSISTGDKNICIGYNSGRNDAPSGAISTADFQICLGNDQYTDLFCADTSISSSDERDKTDIENFTTGLEWVEQMQPVIYSWDYRSRYSEDLSVTPDGSRKSSKKHIGFLAQAVKTIEEQFGYSNSRDDMLTINLTSDGNRYGIKYERLIPVLVNAIKELSTEVNTLKTKVTVLEG
jgi:hypothetical protein